MSLDPATQSTSEPDLALLVGENLRRLRVARGESIEALADRSGVSSVTIGLIEDGDSAPTIDLAWKLSLALGVSFSALLAEPAPRTGTRLLPAAEAPRLRSTDQRFVSRALFTADSPRKVEFYEILLHGGGFEHAEAHAPGTVENLVVTRGRLVLSVAGERHVLRAGDAIAFAADTPHSYRNDGEFEALAYLVVTYAEEVLR